MNEISKQLKKGILEILILKLLSLKDMYGYQLIQELDVKSRGVFAMKEGTLYPILYRLEDDGSIESYWEQESGKRGVPRKYYRITDQGRIALGELLSEFAAFISGVEAILNMEE